MEGRLHPWVQCLPLPGTLWDLLEVLRLNWWVRSINSAWSGAGQSPPWAGWSRAGCLSAQELLQLGHGFPWKGWRREVPRAGFFIFHLCSLPSSRQQDECPGRSDSGTALCDCSPWGWVQPPSSWEGLLRQESGEEGRCVPSPRACLCRSTRVKAPGGISRGWWSVEMALHQYSSVSKTGTSSKHNSISAHQ